MGSQGANRAMEAELKRIARRAVPGDRLEPPLRLDEQTLVYPFSADLAFAAVQYLRTPSRVLWDLYEVTDDRLEPLYSTLFDLVASEERPWLEDGVSIGVDARAVRDFPASPLQLRGTVKNAVIDGAKARGLEVTLEPDRPDVPLVVRGGLGRLTVSIDLVGRSMHARGYRRHIGEAPLKETLAAQMLILARWDARTEVLVDPMCGSGTIVIEAAAMAEGAPLFGANNPPAATRLAPFRDRPRVPPESLFPGKKAIILGNDIDAANIKAARGNLERAGLETPVHFTAQDLCELDVGHILGSDDSSPASTTRGLVITNPPYGERIGPAEATELEALYRAFARWCEGLTGTWRVAMLNAHPAFDEIVGWRPKMRKPMSNGPLRAHFSTYER